MKTTIQALLISLVVHIFYFIISTVIGIIKVKNYVPATINEYDFYTVSSQTVSFGKQVLPFTYVLTFIGLTLFFAVLISLYKTKLKAK